MKNNLKHIRKIKGITQQQLADHLGVSKAMVSMWENNLNEKIPKDRVKPIAEFVNVDEKHLFEDMLDAEVIKKDAVMEEMERLAEKYAEIQEIQQLQLVTEIQKHDNAIHEQLYRMLNEPEKLEKVSRFSEILNDINLDMLFHTNIKPYGLNSLLERVLGLFEEQDTIKLKILYMAVEYLDEIKKNNVYKWDADELLFANDEEFKLAFDNVINKLNLKQA